jgi:hypothetical protein
VDAELAVLDGGPGFDVGGVGVDPDVPEPAVAEIVASDVGIGSGGVVVVVSAVRTALLQPARPAAVIMRPAVISERRDRSIRTSPG